MIIINVSTNQLNNPLAIDGSVLNVTLSWPLARWNFNDNVLDDINNINLVQNGGTLTYETGKIGKALTLGAYPIQTNIFSMPYGEGYGYITPYTTTTGHPYRWETINMEFPTKSMDIIRFADHYNNFAISFWLKTTATASEVGGNIYGNLTGGATILEMGGFSTGRRLTVGLISHPYTTKVVPFMDRWNQTTMQYGIGPGAIYATSVSRGRCSSTSMTVNDGNWHHILINYNIKKSPWMFFYVDGSLQEFQTFTIGPKTIYWPSEPEFDVSSYWTTGNMSMNGKVQYPDPIGEAASPPYSNTGWPPYCENGIWDSVTGRFYFAPYNWKLGINLGSGLYDALGTLRTGSAIDMLYIYQRHLEESEILALYNNGNGTETYYSDSTY